METIYMTQSGVDEMKAELHERTHVIRAEISRKVAEARAHGDLSENAEYHTARDDARKNESRIEEIQEILKRVKVIAQKTHNVVELSARVTLLKNNSTEVVYTVVSPSEADIRTGKISEVSPVGQLLMGRVIGDEFVQSTPNGEVHYKILGIE